MVEEETLVRKKFVDVHGAVMIRIEYPKCKNSALFFESFRFGEDCVHLSDNLIDH